MNTSSRRKGKNRATEARLTRGPHAKDTSNREEVLQGWQKTAATASQGTRNGKGQWVLRPQGLEPPKPRLVEE
jgi:hypothetical protein